MENIEPVNIEPIKQDLEKIKNWVAPITNREDCKFQADNLKAVKIKIKEINEKRLFLVKPLNDTVKNINNLFKPLLDEGERLKEVMEKNILTYERIEIEAQQKAEREQREFELKVLAEQQAKLEEEALKNNSEVDINEAIKLEKAITNIEERPSEVIKGINGDWSKTRIRDNWTYEIVDPYAVPRELCSPDHAMIMAQIKAGVREIKGLKIINKGIVATY